MSPEQLSPSFFSSSCVSCVRLTTPPHCNFCVTRFTNTQKLERSAQWAAKLVHEVSRSYRSVRRESGCFFASLSARTFFRFLLSLYCLTSFSPSSRSPRGPGSCYLNVFLQEPLEEGDGFGKKRERERGNRSKENRKLIFKVTGHPLAGKPEDGGGG